MPVLPAICERCSTVFSSGFAIGDSTHITMVGNRAGPCPSCGGWGRIPDGVYDIVGETIRVLATSPQSTEAWARLASVLEQARKRREDAAAVATSIEKNAPEFKALSDVVGRLRGVRLKDWIVIALAIIAIMQGLGAAESAARQEAKIDQIYNQLLKGEHAVQAPVPSPRLSASPPPSARHIGRNDPCWCGSGLKFKRCHGP